MAAKRKRKNRQNDPGAAELDAIKRLLILQLITSGVQGAQIASALGVDPSVVSRLVPKRKVKKPKR
jgi:predicted transcriptional regulator